MATADGRSMLPRIDRDLVDDDFAVRGTSCRACSGLQNGVGEPLLRDARCKRRLQVIDAAPCAAAFFASATGASGIRPILVYLWRDAVIEIPSAVNKRRGFR